MPPKQIPIYIQRPQKPRTMIIAVSTVKQFSATVNNAPHLFPPLKDAVANLLKVSNQVCWAVTIDLACLIWARHEGK